MNKKFQKNPRGCVEQPWFDLMWNDPYKFKLQQPVNH